MSRSFNHLLFITLSWLAFGSAQAQVFQAAGTLMRGKNALEFYEAAIANPQQVSLLSLEIRRSFLGNSTRYKDLSNDLAQKMGWFNSGPLALEHVELRPEPSQGYQYGYYSITLKKLKFKQCEGLANYAALNSNFMRVELNGSPIFLNNTQQKPAVVCMSQWFFQDGKNELKYVSY